jgi:hypothetical protein
MNLKKRFKIHTAQIQYHIIQELNTNVDVTDMEQLYASIWFTRYDHKGNKKFW